MNDASIIPLRPSDIADELDARAAHAAEVARQSGPPEAGKLIARANGLAEAAAVARGDKPFAHITPEVASRQPLVIELHTPASIDRMTLDERQAHALAVERALASLRVQVDRLAASTSSIGLADE